MWLIQLSLFINQLKKQKMKKIYLTLLAIVAFAGIKAAQYTITTVGNTYSPATLTVNVGDEVTLIVTPNHPTSQVSQTTWNANGTATVSGGWGTKTSAYTFTATTPGNIYYVCNFHVGMGMKGMITVQQVNGLAQNAISLQNVSVFPNPSSEKINVSLASKQNSNAAFTLYSLTGEKVAVLANNQAVIAGDNSVELALPAGLSNGNYFLEITSGSFKTVKKIIVLK